MLHAYHLFSQYNSGGEGCLLEDLLLEMDRIVRPQVIHLVPVIFQSCTHTKKQKQGKLLLADINAMLETSVSGINVANIACIDTFSLAYMFSIVKVLIRS